MSPMTSVRDRPYPTARAVSQLDQCGTPAQLLETRCAELELFIAVHGQLPSVSGGQPAERSLARWALSHLALAAPDPRVLELIESGGGYREKQNHVADRRAQARIRQLAEFIDAHHRLPERAAVEPQEKALGNWAYAHARRKNPDPEALRLIASVGGYGNRGRNAGPGIHGHRIAEFLAFVQTHGRLPLATIEHTAERPLARWIIRHLTNVNPDPRVVQVVEDHGGFPTTAARTTEDRVSELEAFTATHRRLPVHRAASTEEERDLARWLTSHRRAVKPHAQVLEILTRFPPEPRRRSKPAPHSARTEERVAELERFCATHHRLPMIGATTAEEVSLAGWLEHHRRRAVNPHPLVTEIVHAHHSIKKLSKQQRDQQRISELRAFLTRHGRTPRASSADPDEKRLAWWIAEQRRRKSAALPLLRALLREHGLETEAPDLRIPGLVGSDAATAAKLQALVAFVDEHRRLPRLTPGAPSSEREAARFLADQHRSGDPHPAVEWLTARAQHHQDTDHGRR